MTERAFGYDCTTNAWIEYTSPSMIHNPIETISYRMWAFHEYDWSPKIYREIACISRIAKGLALILEHVSDRRPLKDITPEYVYCPTHDAIEKIAENTADFTTTEADCRVEGIPVWTMFTAMPDEETQPNAYHLKIKSLNAEPPAEEADPLFLRGTPVPIRWRIFQTSPSEPLTLLGDIAVFSHRYGREWRTFSLTVSMKTREAHASRYKFRTSPDEIWEGEWTEIMNELDSIKGEIDLPPIVADAVIDALRESVFHFEGIRPDVLSQIPGKAKIMAFIRRPFDLNAVFLKNFLCESDAEFDRLFPYEEKNTYEKICQYLDIRPPKSLRRAYTFNPYAIVWYMIFRQWDIRDVNFMQPFFLLDIRIGPAYIHQFRYDRSAGRVEPDGSENWDMTCEWEAFAHFCQFLKRAKGDRAMMRWLYQYSAQEFLSREQQDTIEAIYEYGRFLPDPVIDRLRDDGLTEQVHNLVSQTVANISKQKSLVYELPCDPLCLAAECDINDYQFRLLQNSADLIDTGNELQNCVASYQRRIMNRQSSIFIVRKNRKLVACIELNHAHRIVQALGPKNRRITGELLKACRLWATKHEFPAMANVFTPPPDALP